MLLAQPQKKSKIASALYSSGMINVETMNILHNKSRNLLVQVFEKNHNAKQTTQDFSVVCELSIK